MKTTTIKADAKKEMTKKEFYTTTEVAELTGVSKKDLERWTSKKYEGSTDFENMLEKDKLKAQRAKTNADKNQGLFDVKRDERNRRIFTRTDFEKVLIIKLYRDYGLEYSKIRDILKKKESLSEILSAHSNILTKELDKLHNKKSQIKLILEEKDDDKKFELIVRLSKILVSAEYRQEIENGIEKIKDRFNEIANDENIIDDFSENINKLTELGIYQKVISKDIDLSENSKEWIYAVRESLVVQDSEDRKPFSWYHFSNDNSIIIDLLLSKEGEILENIYEIFFTLNKSMGFYDPRLEILFNDLKKLINISYFSFKDVYDGYPIAHRLYEYGDRENLKKLIKLGKIAINGQDKNKENLLNYAFRKNDERMITFLLQMGIEVNSSVIDYVVDNNIELFSDLIINSQKDPDVQYFLSSLKLGKSKSVEFLLNNEFEVINKEFITKFRYIHLGMGFYVFPSMKFIISLAKNCQNYNDILLLIEEKVDDENKNDLFYTLIDYKETEPALLILNKFYDKDNEDLYDLFYKVLVYNPDKRLIDKLLSYKIDLNKTMSYYTGGGFIEVKEILQSFIKGAKFNSFEYEKVLKMLLSRIDKKNPHENLFLVTEEFRQTIQVNSEIEETEFNNDHFYEVYKTIMPIILKHYLSGDFLEFTISSIYKYESSDFNNEEIESYYLDLAENQQRIYSLLTDMNNVIRNSLNQWRKKYYKIDD